MDSDLTKRIKEIKGEDIGLGFYSFRDFISAKFTYETLYKKIKGSKILDKRTIKRWFSKEDYISPSRIQIIKLAFGLSLSVKEAENYLIKGIRSYGFQVNDYEEFIYMYGLENRLSYDEAMEMIEYFEGLIAKDFKFKQESDTYKLVEAFEAHKNDPKEKFLKLMIKHMDLFKGYSLSVLNAFKDLMDEAFVFIRQDAVEELRLDLEDTDFSVWETKNPKVEEESELDHIMRYVHNTSRSKRSGAPSAALLKNISWLAHKAYGDKSKNTDLIKEVYNTPSNYFKSEGKMLSDKTLSELLSIGQRKQALMELKLGFRDSEKSEENIKKFKTDLKLERTRIHNIQRNDILPIVHFVASKKYHEKCVMNSKNYNEKDAVRFFKIYANQVLDKCQMAHINRSYLIDYILILCFTEDDMYLFADAMEVFLA